MYKLIRTVLLAIVLFAPVSASAATAAIVGLLPSDTVGPGTPVTFNMQTSGFNEPSYKITDSFPAGAASFNINSLGSFSWTPNKDHVGTHNITVTTSDWTGTSIDSTVTVSVVNPSASITAITPGSTLRFGNILSFKITAPGLVMPTYSVTDSFGNSTVSLYHTKDDGAFIWTPSYQDVGEHKLLVTVKDYRNTATTSQVITVIGFAGVSIANVSAKTVPVGTAFTLEAAATGMVSPVLSIGDSFYFGTTSPITIDASGKVSWTPTQADVGAHFLTLTASSTGETPSTIQTMITVVPANSRINASPSTPPATSNTGTGVKYTFAKDLAVGSRGADVTALQQKLTALGFFKVEATGYFGNVTKLAVQAYQKSVQLPTVGRVGPATRAALNK